MTTPPRLIDSHCHFDDPRLDPDRPQVFNRARAAGVESMVVPGVAVAQWPRQRAVAAAYPGLHCAFGLHPMFLEQHRPADIDLLATWLEREPAVAVGECGLDFFVPGLDPKTQIEIFQAQLQLAHDHCLPVILHARRAVDEVTKYLRRFPGLTGCVHSFSGSEQQARILIGLGFKLGIGGAVTWERARRLQRVVANMELDALLLETDAPDQPGAGHVGQRNEPGYLTEVLDTVARLRHQPPSEIAAAANRNAAQLFRLPVD